MQRPLRPYVTAGVAIAGAGLIAVTPMGPPGSDIQTRALNPTATEGQDFPIVTATQLFDDTSTNLQGLGQEFSESPAPLLDQLTTNWTGYANDLATGFQTAGSNLMDELQDLPTVLQNAFTDLTSGGDPAGLYDAVVSIWDYVLTAPTAIFQPVLDAATTVVGTIAGNLENVLNDPTSLQDLVTAGLHPLNAAVSGVAGVGQDIFTAVGSGDYTTALNDLVNAPSTIADAFLNGYPDDLVDAPQRLSDALVAPQPGPDALDAVQLPAPEPETPLQGFFQGLDPEWGLLTNSVTEGGSSSTGFAADDATGEVGVVRALLRDTFENLLQVRSALADDTRPQEELAASAPSSNSASVAPNDSASAPTDPLTAAAADPASTQTEMAAVAAGSIGGVALPTLSTELTELTTVWNAAVADFTALFDLSNAADIPALLSTDFTDLGGLLLNLF